MALAPMAGGGAPIPNNSGAPIPGPGGGLSTHYLSQIRSGLGPMMVPDEPMVFLGLDSNTSGGIDSQGRLGGMGSPKSARTATINGLLNEFDAFSQKQQRDLAERLARAGLLGRPSQGETLDEFLASLPLLAVRSAYEDLMEDAAQRYAAGQQVTPMQILDQYIEYNKAAAKKAGVNIFGGEPGFTGTKTQTSTSVDIFSAQDARGLARATLRRELDRDPTEEEFEDFVSALQAHQRAHPSRTTTTYTYEDGDLVDQSSVSRGGLTSAGIEEFATRQAQSNPGWAEWQAAGVLFPSALAALGAGVPGV